MSYTFHADKITNRLQLARVLLSITRHPVKAKLNERLTMQAAEKSGRRRLAPFDRVPADGGRQRWAATNSTVAFHHGASGSQGSHPFIRPSLPTPPQMTIPSAERRHVCNCNRQ